jgi:hypothetical protein
VSDAGDTNVGVVFRINTDGTDYRLLHSFNNSAEGMKPAAALLSASDAALYGTASEGGEAGVGSVFSLANLPIIKSLSMTPTSAHIQILGNTNRTYGIEASTNLALPAWEALGQPTVTGGTSGGVLEYEDTNASSRASRYYRIRRD